MASIADFAELDADLIAEMYEDASEEIADTQGNSASISSNKRKRDIADEFEAFLNKVFTHRQRTMWDCEPMDVLTFITKVCPTPTVTQHKISTILSHALVNHRKPNTTLIIDSTAKQMVIFNLQHPAPRHHPALLPGHRLTGASPSPS